MLIALHIRCSSEKQLRLLNNSRLIFEFHFLGNVPAPKTPHKMQKTKKISAFYVQSIIEVV